MTSAVLDLDTAKKALKIENTADDAQLAAFVAAAVQAVDELCGPTDPRPVTEVIVEGGSLVLSTTPVLLVSSIVGKRHGARSVADLHVSPASGVVRSLGQELPVDAWTVTYTAGRPAVPPALKIGAQIILQALWGTQRGPERPVRGGGDANAGSRVVGQATAALPGLGMAVPRTALLVLDPFLRGPAAG